MALLSSSDFAYSRYPARNGPQFIRLQDEPWSPEEDDDEESEGYLVRSWECYE